MDFCGMPTPLSVTETTKCLSSERVLTRISGLLVEYLIPFSMRLVMELVRWVRSPKRVCLSAFSATVMMPLEELIIKAKLSVIFWISSCISMSSTFILICPLRSCAVSNTVVTMSFRRLFSSLIISTYEARISLSSSMVGSASTSQAKEMVAMGVLNSCVTLLMKSLVTSEVFF